MAAMKPGSLAVDSVGNVYVVEYENYRVRRIDRNNVITTVAGSGTEGLSGDGGPAILAEVVPSGIAVDSQGDLYISDSLHHCIRRVNQAGVIETVAGIGVPGFSGDGGPARSAQFNIPSAIAFDSEGNLFVSDLWNARIRRISASAFRTYFPQVAVGRGYKTTLAITNTGSTEISGKLELIGDRGEPLPVYLESFGTGSFFPVSLVAGATALFSFSSAEPTDSGKSGWATLETSGNSVVGVETFSLFAGPDLLMTASGDSCQLMHSATIPIDEDVSQSRLTAYALANPTDKDVSVKLSVLDQHGSVISDKTQIVLKPGEHISRYALSELSSSPFQGSLVLQAQKYGQFIVLALAQDHQRFTVVPPIPGI
jgi:hypothetical protein